MINLVYCYPNLIIWKLCPLKNTKQLLFFKTNIDLQTTMKKLVTLVTVASLFQALIASGQSPIDNAYLLRQLKIKDSSVKVPNTGVWFLKNAGIKKTHFGWLREKDFTNTDSNVLYFEMNATDVPVGSWQEYASGAFQLAVNLPQTISSLNFDTVSKLSYQLINNYTGSTWKQKPTNILSGIITFIVNDTNQIIIDGSVNVDTKNPVTKQQIVFNNFSVPVLTLDEYYLFKKKQRELEEKQNQKMSGAYNLIEKERRNFYDSVFNVKTFPMNKLSATVNGKTKFEYTLDNSYILTDASLTDVAKQDLSELLGGNILTSVQGDKKVFIFHSFYDPVKYAIDDETNYSLSIVLDSMIKVKTYTSNEFNAKLAYWHYGPYGEVITSKNVSGTITITENNASKISGSLSLIFNNLDKTEFSIEGIFELPTVSWRDIVDLENRIKVKLIQYYGDK